MAFIKKHTIRNLDSADAAQDIDDNFDAIFATLRALQRDIAGQNVIIEEALENLPIPSGSFIGLPGDDGAPGEDGPPGPRGSDGRDGPQVPFYIAPGESFTIYEFKQALFSMNIDNEGIIDAVGFLIEVD